MKIILLSIVLLSFLHSDEMKRIEAIVQDISKLRSDYEECKKSLKDTPISKFSVPISNDDGYKNLYLQEKKKSISLTSRNEKLSREIKELKKELNFHQNIVKKKKKSSRKIAKKPLVCEDDNKFPKLVMKEKYEDKIQTFKAASFRLLTESIIYDGINGKKVDKWEKYTSFTSNKKTKTWIKITGYFVDKKWRSARQNLWIKSAQVSRK